MISGNHKHICRFCSGQYDCHLVTHCRRDEADGPECVCWACRMFRDQLSDLLHERRYGSAGVAVSDEELARLVEELVEKVRPRA